MKTTTKLLLAAAMGLLFAQPLSAQPADQSAPAGHEGAGHMGRMGHMGLAHDDHSAFMMLLRSANMTSGQRTQVNDVLRSQREQMKSVYRQFHAVHEQLADKLLSPGTVTAAELAPLEQKAFHCQQQIDQSMIDVALSIRNILTPDQINRLSQVHHQLQALHSQIQSLMGSDQEETGEESN